MRDVEVEGSSKGGSEAGRTERTRDRRPQPERKNSKWQKEGKRLFQAYAVPAIQAEGAKFVGKQLGNWLAKGAA